MPERVNAESWRQPVSAMYDRSVRYRGSGLTAESKVGGSSIRSVPRLNSAEASHAVGPAQAQVTVGGIHVPLKGLTCQRRCSREYGGYLGKRPLTMAVSTPLPSEELGYWESAAATDPAPYGTVHGCHSGDISNFRTETNVPAALTGWSKPAYRVLVIPMYPSEPATVPKGPSMRREAALDLEHSGPWLFSDTITYWRPDTTRTVRQEGW